MPEPNTFKNVTDAVKTAVTDISKQIQGLASDVTGKFRSAFTEEMEELTQWGENIFGRVKTAVTPMFMYLTRFFFKGKFLKSVTDALKGLWSIEKWRQKREKAKMILKKDWLALILQGMGLILGGAASLALGALGMILAPILGPIIKPVEIMVKAFQSIKNGVVVIATKIKSFKKFLTAKDPFGLGVFGKEGGVIPSIVNWIKGLKRFVPKSLLTAAEGGMNIIGKVFDWFKNLKRFIPKSAITVAQTGMSWAGKLGKWIKTVIGWMMKAVRVVGKLGGTKILSMIMKGFNKLFWPLQAIFSAIEFVKGFMSTKGDIVDKFYGGLKAVIKDFFGLPISLFGKLIDWIAEKFGIENLGAEKFLTEGFDKLVDLFISIPLWIKDTIKGWILSAIDWAKTNIDFSTIGQGIYDMFVSLLDTVMTGILGLIKAIPGLEYLARASDMGTALMDKLEKSAEAAGERESDRLAKEALEVQKKTAEGIENLNKKTLGQTQIIAPSVGGSSTGRPTPESTKDSRGVLMDAMGAG